MNVWKLADEVDIYMQRLPSMICALGVAFLATEKVDVMMLRVATVLHRDTIRGSGGVSIRHAG